MEISQKTFVVSGGASGLGLAVAEYLLAQLANVIIADLHEELPSSLERYTDQVTLCHCDVTNEAQVQTAINMAVDRFGELNGVINCAGIATGAKVISRDGPHSLSTFSQTINVNLVGSFNVSRLAAVAIAKATANHDGERGVIINTASIAAFDGQIGQAAYAASKAGVVGLTLPMARELAEYGIRVMAVAPGLFLTPMLAGLPEKVQASLASQPPFPNRLGDPAEFAELVGSIIKNPMLNGEVIRLDGALRMAAE